MIEMVVIVAIPGVLILLLLLSIQNARTVEESAVCLKNLQNVGVADILYLKENNHWFNPNTPKSDADERWAKIWNLENIPDGM
ncbi:MAG: hypothetical protein MK132_15305 [Lentisphaerales bacterium]|nr:hypothetical protein [Lentisphaerales bacterium]